MATSTYPRSGRKVDYYVILGVRADASYREIGDAYWRLASERRDLLPLLNEAYEILNDPRRRLAYNAVRKAAPSPAAAAPAGLSRAPRVRGKLSLMR